MYISHMQLKKLVVDTHAPNAQPKRWSRANTLTLRKRPRWLPLIRDLAQLTCLGLP